MDIEFQCSQCGQALSVDSAGAGSEIECPECGTRLTVPPAAAKAGLPAPPPPEGGAVNPIASSAAAREIKQFVVPQHDKPADSLIGKPLKPLDAAAKESDRKLRVKTFKRTDCVEVGKDHFDEVVTDFLSRVGEEHIVNLSTFAYSHQDMASRTWITDMGVMIVYRG